MRRRRCAIRPAPNSSVPAAPDFSSALPVSEDEAARLLAPLERFSSLALAVSGGGDSLALLHLTAGWARARHSAGFPAPRLLVLTVDHGLRPEAAEEVRFVVKQAEALQIPAKILTWQAPEGLTNLQAEARMARYRLMADAMDLSGVEALVLAHHLDDQIETFFDRLTRGSGVYGLAAMAADQSGGPFGLRLLRPFLTVPGSRLKASLVARGLSWMDDPSNSNPVYKRVRLRQLQAGLLLEGFDPSRISSTIRRMARAAQAIDAAVDVLLKDASAGDVPDFARLDLARLTPLPEEVRLRLLARLAQHVGGSLQPPRLDRLEALDGRLLAGAVFDVSAGGCMRLWPEPGRSLPAAVELLPGQCVHWDGRYRVCLKPDVKGSLRIMPVAQLRQDEGLREEVRTLARASGFPTAAFARLPAVMRLEGGGKNGAACLAWALPRAPGLVLRRTGDQVLSAMMPDN
jgi:tRNA(Ile)-lysidine synthase